jgi:uncharacterized protein
MAAQTLKHLLIPRNTEAEIAALEDVCTRLAGFDPLLSYVWIDGFLTALAAGPRLPDAAQWVQAMLGETFERVFADPEDQARAVAALQGRLKLLCRQLDPEALFDDPETLRLEPLMEEWDPVQVQHFLQTHPLAAEGAGVFQTGAVWAQGFYEAQAAFPDLWQEPADEHRAELFDQAHDQVFALTWRAGSEELGKHVLQYFPDSAEEGPPSRDDLIAEALWSVQDLRMFWVEFAPVTPTIRVESKPGRNDPCYCGSGKKFKKCHGA